jgi:hypothetical protein
MYSFPTSRFGNFGKKYVGVKFPGRCHDDTGTTKSSLTHSGQEHCRDPLVPEFRALIIDLCSLNYFIVSRWFHLCSSYQQIELCEWMDEGWDWEHLNERNKLDCLEIKFKVFLRCTQCFRGLKIRNSCN